MYMGSLNASRIGIKRIRAYTTDDPRRAKKKYVLPPSFPLPVVTNEIQIFCQEAVVWKRFTHPNVLPLLGVTVTPFQLISNWLSGGDLPDYLKKNPGANRLGLVRVPLLYLFHAHSRYQLSDVARGLSPLHSCNVIHGDLKGVCDCSTTRFTVVSTPGVAAKRPCGRLR